MTHNNDDDSPEAQQRIRDSSVALQKIEALQIELQSQPRSLSFAQLADLYLAQNMVDEAEQLLQRSLKYHPNSVSGHMLLGRVYQSQNLDQPALEEFNLCIQRAPSNWACYLLRAQTYLKLEKPKLALKDYKQVMLHNPSHVGVRRSIARLEAFTADDYDEDLFQMQGLHNLSVAASEAPVSSPSTWEAINPKLERVLSLVDAFITRQEYEKAIKLVRECRTEFGEHPEINIRLLKLSPYEGAEKIRPKENGAVSISRQSLIVEKKQKALELLLRRIQENRRSPLVSR